MRVAVIGAGLQGRRRAPVVRAAADDELVVITAAHRESAERLASSLGCAWDVGWETTVSRPDIDALIVATPPNIHEAISVAALSAGKHVLCEKPLARSSQEGARMIHAAETTGRVLWCGFNHRFHPAVQQLRGWVGGGEIGDPRIVRARYGIGGRPGYEREWRADPSIAAGGQLMEQGIHAVDLARWFLGEFVDVVGMTANAYWQTQPLEDNAFVVLRTGDGRIASIHSSLTQWKNLFSFEVLGTAGIARAEGLGGSYGTETASLHRLDFTAPFAETSVEFRGEDPCWRNEWAAFQNAVKAGDIGSGRDGLAALHIVERAYASVR